MGEDSISMKKEKDGSYSAAIGFKYDHHALKVIDQKVRVKLPLYKGSSDYPEMVVDDYFEAFLSSKRKKLEELAYGKLQKEPVSIPYTKRKESPQRRSRSNSRKDLATDYSSAPRKDKVIAKVNERARQEEVVDKREVKQEV